MKNSLFIISGPSGAGEDCVIEGLREYFPIERVITSTTRKMRPSESQGYPYYFISQEDFQKGLEKNEFFEYAKEYNDQYYGVTNKEIERVKEIDKLGIWKVEYKGVMTIKEKMPSVKSILISAPIEILEGRLKKRGNISKEAIQERTEYTKEWYKHKDVYTYEVVNEEGKLDETIKKVADIIKKELNIDN